MRKDSAKKQLDLLVVYQLLDRLTVIKRRYFILNKKDQGCVQTTVNDINDQNDLALDGEF